MPRDFYESTIGAPDGSGVFKVLAGVRISVFNRGTTDLVDIYQRETGLAEGPSPEAGASGATNPFLTGVSGSVQFWCDAPDRYDLLIEDTVVPARISSRTIQWNAKATDELPFSALAADILNRIIPIGGQIPTGANGDPPGGFFLLADGRFVPIATYPEYTAAVGHKYNNGVDPGDGTVKLPDKRGRTSVGADNFGTARGAAGALGSLAAGARVAGQRVGADSHTLTSAQSGMVAHNHGGTTGSHNHGNTTNNQQSLDHTHSAGGNWALADVPGGMFTSAAGNRQFNTQGIGINTSGDLPHTHGTQNATATISTQGAADAAQAHNNLQPSELDNWLVRVK